MMMTEGVDRDLPEKESRTKNAVRVAAGYIILTSGLGLTNSLWEYCTRKYFHLDLNDVLNALLIAWGYDLLRLRGRSRKAIIVVLIFQVALTVLIGGYLLASNTTAFELRITPAAVHLLSYSFPVADGVIGSLFISPFLCISLAIAIFLCTQQARGVMTEARGVSAHASKEERGDQTHRGTA